MSPDSSSYKNFSDRPIPPILYVDTSFIVDALVDGQLFHKESMGFIDEMAKDVDKQPILIFSDILKIELKCAVTSICIRNDYGKNISINRVLKLHPDLIQKYYPTVELAEKQFMDVLQRFKNWTSMPIDEEIINRAGSVMPKYRLGSSDAIHVATMEKWDIKDILTYDWGIEDLPMYKGDCSVWTCNGWRRYLSRSKRRSKRDEELKRLIEEAKEILKLGSRDENRSLA
ncbi:MAG: PIN domain-containing protein [Candidatus Omnitrophica bacterium]|nr:PIN domain-containing protein [Candidatus Omnitrophota bacterium]